MLATEIVEKDDKLSYLPADGLLVLGARSSPEAVVTEIRRRIHAGEQPSAAEIKREIEDAKWRAKCAAEAAEADPTEIGLTAAQMRGQWDAKPDHPRPP